MRWESVMRFAAAFAYAGRVAAMPVRGQRQMSEQLRPGATPSTSPKEAYGGDVSPQEAWKTLTANPAAQLVDVRTTAEWTYVGVSDLSSLGKSPLFVEWQTYPDMKPNARFKEMLFATLAPMGAKPDAPLYFLCRSGVRSRAAAIAMTAEGFTNCFNVAGGFEGDNDEERHRGRTNGWKVAGLPWRQG
jgi:rhodanese-related sulfurtransferase